MRKLIIRSALRGRVRERGLDLIAYSTALYPTLFDSIGAYGRRAMRNLPGLSRAIHAGLQRSFSTPRPPSATHKPRTRSPTTDEISCTLLYQRTSRYSTCCSWPALNPDRAVLPPSRVRMSAPCPTFFVSRACLFFRPEVRVPARGGR